MTHHPCGSLPVHTVNVHAWYCSHHMAWWASVSRHSERADGHLEIVSQRTAEFGPFDTQTEVADFCVRYLVEGLNDTPPPDVPWDRRAEHRTA